MRARTCGVGTLVGAAGSAESEEGAHGRMELWCGDVGADQGSGGARPVRWRCRNQVEGRKEKATLDLCAGDWDRMPRPEETDAWGARGGGGGGGGSLAGGAGRGGRQEVQTGGAASRRGRRRRPVAQVLTDGFGGRGIERVGEEGWRLGLSTLFL